MAALNYRLADGTVFPEPVRDIKWAIRFLKVDAPVHCLRSDQTATWGDSAGRCMALMACLLAGDPYYGQEFDPSLHVSAQIAGGVAWYPFTNMASCDEEPAVNGVVNRYFRKEVTDICVEYEPAVPMVLESKFPSYNRKEWLTRFLEHPMGSGDKTMREASPLCAIHDYIPPVLTQHGNSDEIVPMQQSIRLMLYANTCCGEECVTVEILPNAVHSPALFEIRENLERVFAFTSNTSKIREPAVERQEGGREFVYSKF